MPLATLTVDLVARLASLEAGLTKAGQLAARHAAAMETRWAAAGRTVNTAVSAIGGAAFVAALGSFVRSTFAGVDALNDLADATGASVENISALEDVALRTGTSYETLEKALIRFNAQLLEAGDSKSGAAQVLRNLGLSVDELRKKDPAAALLDVSIALSKFEGNATRGRYVYELFGKSIGEVGPLLKDLAEKGQLNATVTTAQAEEVERLGKALSDFRKNITDVARGLLAELVPGLNTFLDRIKIAREVFGGIGGVISAGFSQAFSGKTFTDAGSALAFYNSELRNTDEAIRVIQARMDSGGGTFIQRRNDPGDLKALKDQRDALAQYAELYRRILNEGGAGAGRGTGGADSKLKLPELPKGKGDEKAKSKSFEDYALIINKSIAKLIEGTPTAKLAELNAQLAKLDEWAAAGLDPKIVQEVRDALLPPAGADMGPPISDELKRVQDLLGKTDSAKLKAAQRDVALLRAEFDATAAGTQRWYELSDAILDTEASIDELLGSTGIVTEKVSGLAEDFQSTIVEGIGGTLSKVLRGEFDSIGEMWGNLLLDMAARAIQAEIGKLLLGTDGKSGLFATFFTWLMSAKGNVFAGGNVTPFRRGGVVDRPTAFAFGGSNLGIMGEAGPEAIMPLRRGRDGALGVVASGGSGLVVNQVINVQSGVSRNEMMQAGDAIRRATIADIRDMMRRGNLAFT